MTTDLHLTHRHQKKLQLNPTLNHTVNLIYSTRAYPKAPLSIPTLTKLPNRSTPWKCCRSEHKRCWTTPRKVWTATLPTSWRTTRLSPKMSHSSNIDVVTAEKSSAPTRRCRSIWDRTPASDRTVAICARHRSQLRETWKCITRGTRQWVTRPRFRHHRCRQCQRVQLQAVDHHFSARLGFHSLRHRWNFSRKWMQLTVTSLNRNESRLKRNPPPEHQVLPHQRRRYQFFHHPHPWAQLSRQNHVHFDQREVLNAQKVKKRNPHRHRHRCPTQTFSRATAPKIAHGRISLKWQKRRKLLNCNDSWTTLKTNSTIPTNVPSATRCCPAKAHYSCIIAFTPARNRIVASCVADHSLPRAISKCTWASIVSRSRLPVLMRVQFVTKNFQIFSRCSNTFARTPGRQQKWLQSNWMRPKWKQNQHRRCRVWILACRGRKIRKSFKNIRSRIWKAP